MPDSAGHPGGGPHPLTQFVLKVHGRCDLACDHCYIYEHADQSWRRKERVIEPATVRAAAARIAEHAAAWGLPRVSVVLHGGEPLLLGPRRLRAILTDLRGTIEPVTRLSLIMQTNGVRLTEDICDALVEFGVRVGVSLDGDQVANDRHRRFADGRSSHPHARRALALLRRPAYRELYGGILCTIDLRNDPVDVYRALAAEQPPRVDFLLPHATWDAPPARPSGDPTPYATWLARIHQLWTADGRPMHIRLFDSLRSTADGGPSGSEQLGTDAADLVVIETDGSWEQADSLKTAYPGAPETGLSVRTHSVDDVSRHAAIRARQSGLAGLSEACRACPVVSRCGGGLYAHRYRSGSGFDNPSVYCTDLKELILRMDRAEHTRAADSAAVDARHARFFDEIAGGLGGDAAIRWLAGTQVGITRALLVAVADAAAGHAAATDAWNVLVDVDREAPEAIGRVLSHPYLRPWASAVLRAADHRGADHHRADDRAFGYLPAVAAAAALHAGVEAELVVGVRDGTIFLPTLGTVRLADGGATRAQLSLGHRGFTVLAGEEKLTVDLTAVPTPWWQPVRRVVSDGLDVPIEDGDPYRDCHDWAIERPLDAQECAAWQRQITLAWRLIEREAPAQVGGLRAGLRAIVPLAADPGGMMRASTARDAFGAVAVAPAEHPALAVMLVHEFQHSKLGALLDLYDLYDPSSQVTISVGWRPDRRPVEGALQGTYAHLAVAEIWRGRAARAGADGPAARRSYVQYRDWTLAALDDLRGCGALTPLGEHLVGRMAAATDGWPA